MWRDCQFGLRQLWRRKLFAGGIILLLSIGIGASTLIFSFVNALLLKPLPVRDPESLFLLEKNRALQVRPDPSFFYRQFEEVARTQSLISAVVAEQEWSDASFQPLADGDSVRLVTTQMVSANYFSELGLRALVGRTLTAGDATQSGEIPALISYEFWQAQFYGSRDIIGRTIRIKNFPFRVIGVLARDFHDLDIDRSPDVRLPISASRPLLGHAVTEPGGDSPLRFNVLARLKPEVSAGRAAAGLLSRLQPGEEVLWRNWYDHSANPWPRDSMPQIIKNESEYRLTLAPAGHGVSRLRDQFSKALVLLMGAVGLLLFAICANVAGLLSARFEERKREMAIRSSVGAGHWRLTRQLMVENILLAGPSCLLAIAFTYGLAPWLVRLLPAPRGYVLVATQQVLRVRPDVSVLLFALAIAVLSLLVFGVLPARRAAKHDLMEELKGGGRTATGQAHASATIAIQAGLGMILLTASVLMLRTFWTLEHLNPGFDRAHVVEFTIDAGLAGYNGAQQATFRRKLRELVTALPGVRSISYAFTGLMRGVGTKSTVTPQGRVLPKQTFLNTNNISGTPEYFATLGIPLLAGRSFNLGDVGQKPARVVVNRAFVSFFFPHEDALGKAVVQGTDGTKPPTAVIVGVVGTAKYRSLREVEPPIVYRVVNDEQAGEIMYVRTRGDPAQIIGAVRKIVRRLDPRLPVIEVFTLEQEVQNSLWQERLVTILAGFFGVVALTLSAIGLYAALAFAVERRWRELGIRIAVGAQASDILRTLCGRMTVAVTIGIAGGLLAAIAMLRLARSLFFGVDALDPWSLAAAATVLLLGSLGAAVFPSWRAARTDPARALREE